MSRPRMVDNRLTNVVLRTTVSGMENDMSDEEFYRLIAKAGDES